MLQWKARFSVLLVTLGLLAATAGAGKGGGGFPFDGKGFSW